MKTISLVIPFATAPEVPTPDDPRPDDEILYGDEDTAKADILITGIYLVQDVAQAAPLLAAAEALGFAATYTSGDPHNDEDTAVETITASGRAVEE